MVVIDARQPSASHAEPTSPTDGRQPRAKSPKPNPWLVALAVTVGTLMGALDTSIVNVALPYIRANLGATVTEIAWISTGYIIALVIIMPLTAWLGLTFGRKRVYMTCLALFTTASFFCGTARSLTTLVFFRVLQGMGAGALQPTEQAILRETFPAEKQGMAMGLYGLAVMVGPAIGPTLGGWITDNYNWPWIFFINIPIGMIGLWLVNQVVHDPPDMKAQRGGAGVDAVGIGLLAVGLASLQTVLEEGQTYDWFSSAFITTLAIASAVATVLFVAWELRAPRPAVDLRVLKNGSFATGTFIGGVLGVCVYSSMFLLPLFTQELQRYPAVLSGLVLMPRSVAMLLMMLAAGALYNRLGPKLMIGSGLATASLALAWMSRITLQTTAADLFWPQVVQGIGFGLIFVPLTTAALAGVEHANVASATGLYNLVRQLGASFGTAVFATTLASLQQANHAALAAHIRPAHPAFAARFALLQQGLITRGFDAWHAHTAALAIIERIVSGQASVLAFERSFFILGALFFSCLPLVLLLRADRPQSRSPGTDRTPRPSSVRLRSLWGQREAVAGGARPPSRRQARTADRPLAR